MESLKSRLITAATVWIMLGMLAAGVTLSAVFRSHATEQFYEELYVHLAELQRLSEFSDGQKAHLQRNLSDPRYDVPLSGFYWEIQQAGEVLARSSSLDGPRLEPPDDTIKNIGVHTHEIAGPTGQLLLAEKAVWRSPSEQPVRFMIGTDERHLESVVGSFNKTLAMSLSVFGLSLVGAAAFLIYFALAPLQELRSALSRVRTGEASRLKGRFPSEVTPLVDDLNTLLSSTTEFIQRARTQAGNIAHGLKTPLAILTDEGYKLAEKGEDAAANVVLEQCSQMQKHINYQITRARAVAMRSSPGVVADLYNACNDVTSALSRMHRGSGVKVNVSVPKGLQVACDPEDINEMIANLVDNAFKHAKSAIWVSHRESDTPDTISIAIEDDGPGLPIEAQEVVFNIGERWDSEKKGTGLGLAIVRDLARLYSGECKLEGSPKGGLKASLTLPKAKPV